MSNLVHPYIEGGMTGCSFGYDMDSSSKCYRNPIQVPNFDPKEAAMDLVEKVKEGYAAIMELTSKKGTAAASLGEAPQHGDDGDEEALTTTMTTTTTSSTAVSFPSQRQPHDAAALASSSAAHLGYGYEKNEFEGCDEDFEAKCDADDPWGPEPSKFQLTFIIDVTSLENGFRLEMRQMWIGRIALIFTPNPFIHFEFTKKLFNEYIMMFKPILDLVGFDKLLLEVNIGIYPVESFGGTAINPGLLIEVCGVNIFNIVNVTRLTMHLSIMPPKVEFHLFVEPIRVIIAGAKLFAMVRRYMLTQSGC